MGDKKEKSKRKNGDSGSGPDQNMAEGINEILRGQHELKKGLEEKIETVLTELKNLQREHKQLQDYSKKQSEMIKQLEARVEDLDQQTRLNEVIITGIKIKPRSYAKALTNGRAGEHESGQDEEDIKTVEKQVADFMESKDIEMDFNNVEYCHLMPWKGASGGKVVKLRFTNRKHKIALLKQGPKLKGTMVFFNENLTKKNAEMAKKARELKKAGKIKSTWTANCKILIRTNGETPEEMKTVLVKSMEDLDKFNA